MKPTFTFLATVQADGLITVQLVEEPVYLQHEVVHFGIPLHDQNALIGIYFSPNYIADLPTGEQIRWVTEQVRLEVSRLVN